ncbi:hypothetical protein [Paracoccus shandongensis]|uniref:hypothetical protein n=1 Tax=Paracoccus shandongensis TaxID=2816048 RepID=UPI001A8D5245|nr:hypothetical protein [Paracoccus shandongensis]
MASRFRAPHRLLQHRGGVDPLPAMAGKAAQAVGRVTFILGDQDGFRGQRVFSHSRSPPPCWPTGG